MQRTMKSSTSKVVIVEINGKKNQVTVDSAIYDDIFIEAATRVVEKHRKNLSFFHKINCVGKCYEKTNDAVTHYQINMYYVLMNAGLYSIAELLRTKTKDIHKVDLQDQPVREHVGKPNS